MLECVRDMPAADLGAQGYLDDFWQRSTQSGGDIWKLERIQHFREPEEPSWTAMNDGDWHHALTLIEEKRTASKQHVIVNENAGNRRLRVIERPITPYVQWEMHVLKIWVESGAQDIKVIDAAAVQHLESGRPLPELVLLGPTVMYEVLYDSAGNHSGGRRIEDRDAISACRTELIELYGKGEDLLSFFTREIAVMPPPKVSD